MERKVIVRKIKSPHQGQSFTHFLPLDRDMVREIRRTVAEMFQALGGPSLLKASCDVYIKPNGIDAKPYCYTRPEVVAAAVEYWQQAGARRIYLMENSTQANYTRVVFVINSYLDICRDTGAIPLYLDEEKTERFAFTGKKGVHDGDPRGYDLTELRLPLTVAEKLIRGGDENLYISIPKLKTHSMSGATLGIKNQWGFPVHESRGMDHNYNLHHKLVDVLSLVRPDVTLIEGIEGTVYGHYPVTALADRCIKPFRILLASRNVVAADLAAAAVLGFDSTDVPHIDLAIKRGLGDGVAGAGDLEFEGDVTSPESLDLLRDRPPEGKYPADLFDSFPLNVKILRGRDLACREGCVNNPLTLLQVLFHDHGGRGGWTLVMGKGFDADDIDQIEGKVLVAGHCAVEEVGGLLVERLGRRNVYFSGECNDLVSTAQAMFHLMRVNPPALLRRRKVRALPISLPGSMGHAPACRVPSRIFSRWSDFGSETVTCGD